MRSAWEKKQQFPPTRARQLCVVRAPVGVCSLRVDSAVQHADSSVFPKQRLHEDEKE